MDEIQETIDTQAAENEVTEIKTESGVEVRIPAKAYPKEILDKSDVKIDISTANSKSMMLRTGVILKKSKTKLSFS